MVDPALDNVVMPTEVAQQIFASLLSRLRFMQRMVAFLLPCAAITTVVAAVALVATVNLTHTITERHPVGDFIAAAEIHADCVAKMETAYLLAVGKVVQNPRDPETMAIFAGALDTLAQLDSICPPATPPKQQD